MRFHMQVCSSMTVASWIGDVLQRYLEIYNLPVILTFSPSSPKQISVLKVAKKKLVIIY
jgi:hypothetical protein